MDKILNYINGKLIEPVSNKWLENYNPAIGTVYSLIPDSTNEDVENAQVQAVGRHDVVGLATIHNGTNLHQDHSAHQQDDARRDDNRHNRNLQENVRDHADYHHHHANGYESAHEGKVALRGHGVTS